MTKRAKKKPILSDWTINARTGRSNSSPQFERLVREVESLIRGGAHSLIAGDAGSVARLVVARLAHVHGMAPKRTRGEQSISEKER